MADDFEDDEPALEDVIDDDGPEELDDDLVIRIAIIALLAIVRTALSVAEIRCFLVRRGVLPASASPIAPDARVSLLLASLSTVLRRSVAFDEVDRYALYHHSFRTHVLSSNRLRASVAAAVRFRDRHGRPLPPERARGRRRGPPVRHRPR